MIDLDQFPCAIRERVARDISKYGEWFVNSCIYMAPLWRMIDELKETDPDISWMITVVHLIDFFGTKDPLPVHYAVSREILETKKIFANKAVDMLARELVGVCQKFKQFMEKECYCKCDISLPIQYENGYLVPESEPFDGFIYEKEGCNIIDFFFSNFLEKHFLKTGKKASKSLLEDSKKRLKSYIDSNFEASKRSIMWDNWISKQNGKTTIFSPHLLILTDVVWEDCCVSLWDREKKYVPALTQGVHPSVTKILSNKMQVEGVGNATHLTHETQSIAKLPTVDPSLMRIVTEGIEEFNSIYHHKLIRFECKSGFENWVSGKTDPRVLRFDRGCSEIVEMLGIKTNQAIGIIKALLHAQAYLQFNFEDGSSGNLIVLSKFQSSSSGRKEGIILTLGLQLLPHYTFQTSKRRRLLIPVPELPPLIGSSNSHASQATLQMLLMKLFADKSIELADFGSISIDETEWEKMCKEAGISRSLFKQTLDRWLNDGNDGPKMLIESGIGRYSLGPAYSKEEKFLVDQGLLRKKRKKGGEKSALQRNKF